MQRNMRLFNNLLRGERKRNNLLQSEVSSMTGIPASKISRYECRHQIPSPTNLEKLLICYQTDKKLKTIIYAAYNVEVLLKQSVRGAHKKERQKALGAV